MTAQEVVPIVCVLLLSICLWRITGCLSSLSGEGMRAKQHERSGHLRMIERLLEKKRASSVAEEMNLIQIHTQERVSEAKEETKRQVSASASDAPSTPKPKFMDIGAKIAKSMNQ